MATPSCKLEDMDEQFLKQLDKLREYCGFPLVVNCFYRSVEHDKKKDVPERPTIVRVVLPIFAALILINALLLFAMLLSSV